MGSSSVSCKTMLETTTLLFNGVIVTMDPESRVFRNGAILIVGESITDIGQSSELLELYEGQYALNLVDLNGRFVLPGLFSTHVHTSLHLERNLACDIPLLTWLSERALPFEANLTEEDSYISTLACGIELIHSGVTCFAEAGGQHVPGMARAVEELGMRAVLAQSNIDFPEGLPGTNIPPPLVRSTDEIIESQIELYNRFNGTADGRLKFFFAIRQILISTDELLTRTRDTARELQTGIHMHVAEINAENETVEQTRGAEGTITFLEQIDLLNRNFLAAVAVWVNNAEIGFLANAEVSVSHCPDASMHYFGFAPVDEMLEAGIPVSLGTDGPSNNRMSIVDEMYIGALLNKIRPVFATGATDPTVLPAETVLRMATIYGARSVLWENELGSLEVGKKADLIVVNPSVWTTVPVIDIIANLVYSMRTENIESVMCNGKWIMRERVILTVDEESVLKAASRASREILTRAGISVPQRMNFV